MSAATATGRVITNDPSGYAPVGGCVGRVAAVGARELPHDEEAETRAAAAPCRWRTGRTAAPASRSETPGPWSATRIATVPSSTATETSTGGAPCLQRVVEQVLEGLGQPVPVAPDVDAGGRSATTTSAVGFARRTVSTAPSTTASTSTRSDLIDSLLCWSRDAVRRSSTSRLSREVGGLDRLERLGACPRRSSGRRTPTACATDPLTRPTGVRSSCAVTARNCDWSSAACRSLRLTTASSVLADGQRVEGVLALVLEPPSLAGVAGDLGEADVLAGGVAHGGDDDVGPEAAAVLADPPALLLVVAVLQGHARARAPGARPRRPPAGRRRGSAGR